jgi:hypothetical protein
VIVTGRDGSEAQRWALEPAAAPGGSGESREKRAEDTPRENRGQRTRRPHDDAPPGPPDSTSRDLPQERYEPRFAQVGCCEETEPGADEAAPTPGPDVLGPATATAADAVRAVRSVVLPAGAATAVRSVALP